ncbi:MAG: hypothetical protein J0H01_25245 [Rhizobiales bacterium]|nr:hypothetical protein [Hyphomicrobiales bacterium]
MSERTLDDVMDSLSHLLDDFDSVARSAHERYRAYPPAILIEHSPRAAATCTYDHMVAEADRRFFGRPDVRSIDMRGLKLWLVGDHSVVRLKKMDEDGVSRNYPTKQAKDFDAGEELPGLPLAPTRLSVGYLLDPTGTQFVRSQIARPHGRKALWCAAIIPTEQREAGKRAWRDVTRQGSFGR